MTNHIDLGSVLRTVCDLYSNLVTRSTGAAVRREIEHVLTTLESPSLMVIDFSQVGLLDFSCADEVLGKLLAHLRSEAAGQAFVLVRGVSEHHLDAIEAVLERYGLAVTVETCDGQWHVIGPLEEPLRRTLEVVLDRGRIDRDDVAILGAKVENLEPALDRLWRSGLLMRDDTGYVSLPSAL
ncbi:MAG TPA: hypothetical protein VF178_00970 [Gemmatimonadaceae bacterium]